MKVTGPENPVTKKIASNLKRSKSSLWKTVGKTLVKPRRIMPEMNISRLNRYCKAGESIVVPGKVLGSGEITFPLSVAALAFSESAKKKIIAAGGSVHSLDEMMEKSPKGMRLMK